jgi:hypothetical protein
VVDALGQAKAGVRQPVAVVVLRPERPFDVDVDPAHGVDHGDEADEVDPRVVVDRDAEQRADRVLEGAHPALGEGLGIALGERQQRVQLGAVDVSVAERHVDHVARQRDHRDRLADGVERGDDHRVGQ